MEFVKLNECCKKITDYVASGSFASLKENVKVYKHKEYAILVKIADFANNFTKDLTYTDIHGYKFLSNSNLFGGELILSNIGSIGKVFIVPNLEHPMTLASNSIMVVPNDDYLIKYLYYFFLSSYGQKQLFLISSATSMPKFNKTQLKTVLIPKNELRVQRKIINDLDNINHLIDNCKKQIVNFDNIVKSQFIEMFGDLTSNYDYPKFKIDDLAFVTKLAGFEFTEYINYQSNGDIIMLRGLNCKNGKLVLDDIKWIDVETSKKLPRSQLFNGDILMTYAGTVGDVALVDEDDKYHLAPNVAKISLNDKLSNNPIFFIHLFMFTKDYILSHTTGVAQMALSMKKIRDFEYHIPPIELQNKFANFVQQIDKSKLNKAMSHLM